MLLALKITLVVVQIAYYAIRIIKTIKKDSKR